MVAGDPATVLVVDDETDVADAYAAMLADEYIVDVAYDGQAALDMIDVSIDVVLLDRRMPGISGDEVLEQIRDREVGCRVAMVTAVEPDFDVIAMGFDDYVTKPVSRDELLATVDGLLNLTDYEDGLQEYYALSAKAATLRATKSDEELAASEQFARLEARLEEIQTGLDESLDEFDTADFATVFRDLDGPIR